MVDYLKPISRRDIAIAVGLLATSGAMAQSRAVAQPRVLVLEGGTLIDGTGRAPITSAVIVADGSRIKAVGSKGQIAIPANATVINTDGRTILPGLIDSHTHAQDFYIPMFLRYGITTIQDKDNDPAWAFAQREALQNGTIKGPRMFIAGPSIFGTLAPTPARGFNTRPVTTVDGAVAYARTLIASGVDILNVENNVTDEQLRALIRVANEAGVPLQGSTRNIRRAAEMGHKYQEHMVSMAAALLDPDNKTPIGFGLTSWDPSTSYHWDPDMMVDPKEFPPLIDFMVNRGVFVNPTLVAQWSGGAPAGPQFLKEQQQLAQDPDLAFVPAEVRAGWNRLGEARDGYENVAQFLREYAAAGGKVIVGSDASHKNIAGLSLHYEMKMLVDAGISPMKVIQGATLWNAQLIQKDKDLGSVEPGKIADLVVIEGDPLADVMATRNIRLVIKDGSVVDTGYDPKWINPIPGPRHGFGVYDPPEITKISPPIVRQGSETATLHIEGNGFTTRAEGFRPTSIVRFDNVDLPTKFVSDKKLTAALDAKLLQRSPGFYPIYVVTPGLHGSVSSPAYHVIDTESAPVSTIPVSYAEYASDAPRLFGPTPRNANQDGQTITLEVEGTKFAPNATVRFDTVDLPTRFVNSTKLTATLDAKLLHRNPGSYVLYVLNPGVFGTVSETGYFQVSLKNSKISCALI
jgi:hypothetical protein